MNIYNDIVGCDFVWRSPHGEGGRKQQGREGLCGQSFKKNALIGIGLVK